jgi:hypothetical protein
MADTIHLLKSALGGGVYCGAKSASALTIAGAYSLPSCKECLIARIEELDAARSPAADISAESVRRVLEGARRTESSITQRRKAAKV